jgi:hypothetical protein
MRRAQQRSRQRSQRHSQEPSQNDAIERVETPDTTQRDLCVNYLSKWFIKDMAKMIDHYLCPINTDHIKMKAYLYMDLTEPNYTTARPYKSGDFWFVESKFVKECEYKTEDEGTQREITHLFDAASGTNIDMFLDRMLSFMLNNNTSLFTLLNRNLGVIGEMISPTILDFVLRNYKYNFFNTSTHHLIMQLIPKATESRRHDILGIIVNAEYVNNHMVLVHALSKKLCACAVACKDRNANDPFIHILKMRNPELQVRCCRKHLQMFP